MNSQVFLVAAVVLFGYSEQAAVHSYNSRGYDKIEIAGSEAQKIIEVTKIESEAEKRCLFNQANDFYHYISNAPYLINKAVYGRGLSEAKKKELNEVGKVISEFANSVLQAINEANYTNLREKLTAAIEGTKNKVQVLSRLKSDADNPEAVDVAENYIDPAAKALLRGYFQIKGRYTFHGKSKEEVENHVNETVKKANAEMNQIQGDDKTIARVLVLPASNLVDFIDRVLQYMDDLLYDENNITNGNSIRDLYKRLANLYGETVELKIRFVSETDGPKLREDLIKLSSKTGTLFHELSNHISGRSATQIAEEVLPQTETGALFLFYYLDLFKNK